jgi:hypothetical protein
MCPVSSMVELSAVNRSVVGSSPTLGAIAGLLEKWLNSHAFHACIRGFESRIGHQSCNKALEIGLFSYPCDNK